MRIVQSLVRLLGLAPTQLNLTQANFTAVMALPTFATKPGSFSPFSSTAAPVLKSSNTTVKLTGLLPGDVRDPDILMYDDPTEDAAAVAATRNSTAFPAAVAGAKSGLIYATSDSNSGTPAELSPLLLPLPSYESVRFTCDAVRIAGRSASLLDAPAIARMNDGDILDCVEVFGRLDLSAAANVAAIAAEVWRPFGGDLSANGRPVLGGNLMAMLDNLVSGLLTNSSLLNQVDFSFKTNFDGLGVLGMRFREMATVLTSYNSSNSNSTTFSGANTTSSPTAALLTSQYLAANAGTGGQQQRQLTDVEVAGLGQLLCGLNGTQWLTAISPSVAVGVREAVMAALMCTVSDEVNFAELFCVFLSRLDSKQRKKIPLLLFKVFKLILAWVCLFL